MGFILTSSRRTALALTPFHGGFGLLNYQGIRKPAYYAFRFLNQLGSQELLPSDAASWVTETPRVMWRRSSGIFTPIVPPAGMNDQVFYKKDLPAKDTRAVRLEMRNFQPAGTGSGYRTGTVEDPTPPTSTWVLPRNSQGARGRASSGGRRLPRFLGHRKSSRRILLEGVRDAGERRRPGAWCGSYRSIIVLEGITVAKRKQHQIAKRMIGRYIVADPEICHGQRTFRGLESWWLTSWNRWLGRCWETIVEGWRGDVSPDAISEAYDWRARRFAIIPLSTWRRNTCSAGPGLIILDEKFSMTSDSCWKLLG